MNTMVITGASSGIGKATALYFAQQGWQVAATMRNPENASELTGQKNISLYPLDVTDPTSIAQAQEAITNDFARIDVVINNAGYALSGVFEAATPEQIQQQFNTNVFGAMAVTQAFLPHFRQHKSGVFINVSSLLGLLAYPFTSVYSASKFALEGFSESLAYELSSLGIRVKLIEPGGVNTDFNGRSMQFAYKPQLDEYNQLLEIYSANYKQSQNQPGQQRSSAEQLAEAIFNAATDQTDTLRYPVGEDCHSQYQNRLTLGSEAFVRDMAETLLR